MDACVTWWPGDWESQELPRTRIIIGGVLEPPVNELKRKVDTNKRNKRPSSQTFFRTSVGKRRDLFRPSTALSTWYRSFFSAADSGAESVLRLGYSSKNNFWLFFFFWITGLNRKIVIILLCFVSSNRLEINTCFCEPRRCDGLSIGLNFHFSSKIAKSVF